MRALVAMLLALALAAPAWAEPALKSLLPEKAAVGSTVFVTGTGFGSDRAAVTVRFGEVPGKVIVVRDTSLGVNVPEGAPASCEVTVEIAGQRSNPLPFQVAEAGPDATPPVRLRLDVGKNPLGRGEETTGVFTVEGTADPVRIHFVNSDPEVVEFVGGNEQTVTSTGGADNRYVFTIRGLAGPRLYRVAYDWKRGEAPEPQEWKLPWGRVDVTAKPGR